MKSTVKNCCLLGLSFIFTFGVISFVNITNALVINPSASTDEHSVRLHSLFLWIYDDPSDAVSMSVKNGGNKLELKGGLMVGEGNDLNNSSSVIGGGKGNTVSADNAGILGGNGNTNNGNNSLIGGGKNNNITSESSIIGGGSGNTVSAEDGVIVGGADNIVKGKKSVILGGQKNMASGENALVLGYNSKGDNGSFARRANAKNKSARINASGGVLIGTNNPINGVRLVVNGPVSLPNLNNTGSGITGEIKVVKGCIYAYDGNNWQVMGKSSKISGKCGSIGTCKFGEVYLAKGDKVMAYSEPFSTKCESIMTGVTCNNDGTFSPSGYIYPYCYKITGNH